MADPTPIERIRAEVEGVLAKHRITRGQWGTLCCRDNENWPCETRRLASDKSVRSLIERIGSMVVSFEGLEPITQVLSDCKTALLELTCEPSCEKHTPKKGMTSEEEAYRDSLNGQREPGHMGEPAT